MNLRVLYHLKVFVQNVKKIIPDIEEYMFEKGGTAGLIAQGMRPEKRIDQGRLYNKKNIQIHVLNLPSFGATVSLYIAQYIIHQCIKENNQ